MFDPIALVVSALRRWLPAKTQQLHYVGEFPVIRKAAAERRQISALPVPVVHLCLEVGRIIQENNLTPQIIKGGAGVKEITWGDQWIAYDDADTLILKLELANKHCLGGTSLWAIDYSQCDGKGGPPQLPGSSSASGSSPSASSKEPSSAASSQASATASSAVSSPQPSSEAGSSGSAPTNTGSYASGSSVVISSGASTGQQSSTVGSSDAESSNQACSVQGSGSGMPGSSASTTPGASNSPTQSPADGSSAALSTPGSSVAKSSTFESSGVASSTNGGSSAWSSTTSGSEPSSDSTITWTGTSSGSLYSDSTSSAFAGSPTGSTSLSDTWGSSISTAPSSESQDSSQAGSSAEWGSSTVSGSSVINTSGGSTQTQSSSRQSSDENATSNSSSSSPIGSSATQSSDAEDSSQGPSSTSQAGSSNIQPSGSLSSQKPTSFQGSSTVSGVSSSPVVSSSESSPTATGCPEECESLLWCQVFCEGWKFPRPDDVQPPSECLLPENANWCRNWWWGAPSDDGDSDGDPDSHSDSDPNCKPNDCIKDCVAWNVITFLATKRPFCPCVPKKCDKGADSDSPSDSDNDDPKNPQKPTSTPKEKNPGCKLFGCGCGWMGLGFGPGCPGMEIDFDIPCGLFGCDPCIFFGCPGIRPKGIVGYDGHCLGEGCDPCPPELCKRPDCTIPGGCGPKPGPAPTKPADLPDPEECDDSQRTVITERFVWCTEEFNVSALPSSMRGTSSTMISSMCLPMIDVTLTICGGAMPGFETTTTQTGKSTLTSDAPACTRAPLSLDDDEGNNNPDDPLSTSSTYASNTTIASSTETSSSSKSSSTSSTTKTSFAPPSPSLGPMDKKGRWKVNLNQYMNRDYSEVKWQLFDPNGNHAGENKVGGNDMEIMRDEIKSINRPVQHSMPFAVKLVVTSPRELDDCNVELDFQSRVWRCDKDRCSPFMRTQAYIEDNPSVFCTYEQDCDDGFEPPMVTGDLCCQDLNDADWYPDGSGWRRDFECGWKGYRPAESGPI